MSARPLVADKLDDVDKPIKARLIAAIAIAIKAE